MKDTAFEDADDVSSISLRLHPLDVGFNLRAERISVDVSRDLSATLRVSYAARSGERRVMEGPREEVIAKLRRLGYQIIP